MFFNWGKAEKRNPGQSKKKTVINKFANLPAAAIFINSDPTHIFCIKICPPQKIFFNCNILVK
jgi:hypothetical protein